MYVLIIYICVQFVHLKNHIRKLNSKRRNNISILQCLKTKECASASCRDMYVRTIRSGPLFTFGVNRRVESNVTMLQAYIMLRDVRS